MVFGGFGGKYVRRLGSFRGYEDWGILSHVCADDIELKELQGFFVFHAVALHEYCKTLGGIVGYEVVRTTAAGNTDNGFVESIGFEGLGVGLLDEV